MLEKTNDEHIRLNREFKFKNQNKNMINEHNKEQ